MKVEQIYTGCLAEAAYYIESKGEAVIIDPLRETKPYLDRAKADGAKIKYVMETHFHADFVSGHLDLAKETGATIVYGPTAKPNYDAHIATDEEVFKVGDISIIALHTPGHTMESTTYLLRDEQGKDYALFTGDTLFIGDVGRPDLAVKSDLSREDLAGFLYESLRTKIMPLDDEVMVYPGHGAGSACGKRMSNQTSATLGTQKELNYALRADMTKEEFVQEVTDGLVEPPQYFPKNAVMNRMGYQSFDKVLERGQTAFSLNQFKAVWESEEALIIDTRTRDEFVKGFIPGSIFIGLDGSFASWVGALIPELDQPILFIAPAGKTEEVVTRLSRVGYDNSLGYLEGGFETWKVGGEEIDTIPEIRPEELTDKFELLKMKVLDVRKKSEYLAQHLEGVENFPLDFINRNMSQLNPESEYILHCVSGYRSVIAASILKTRGYEKVWNVPEGFNKLKTTGLIISKFVEPKTML